MVVWLKESDFSDALQPEFETNSTYRFVTGSRTHKYILFEKICVSKNKVAIIALS